MVPASACRLPPNVALVYRARHAPPAGAAPCPAPGSTRKKPEHVQVEVREQAIRTTGLGADAAAVAADDVRLPGVDDGGETLTLRYTLRKHKDVAGV